MKRADKIKLLELAGYTVDCGVEALWASDTVWAVCALIRDGRIVSIDFDDTPTKAFNRCFNGWLRNTKNGETP